MEPRDRQDQTALASVGQEVGLHVCVRCASTLVQPEWWEETDGGSWRVGLRCPDCEHRREGIYSQGVVDAYDELLNDGADALTTAYRRLVRDNLVAEMERFAGALRAGAILPEDF
jgi:DNA-directed RNA polymerase subunit RPC12/RpoP